MDPYVYQFLLISSHLPLRPISKKQAGRTRRQEILCRDALQRERPRNTSTEFRAEFPFTTKDSQHIPSHLQLLPTPSGLRRELSVRFRPRRIVRNLPFQCAGTLQRHRFLEREGLLLLPEIEDSESKVYVPISREELYKFQVDQPKYSDLLFLLLRLYGGLFSDFVPISGRLLARRMFMDVEQITNMLLHMDALSPKRKDRRLYSPLHASMPKTSI